MPEGDGYLPRDLDPPSGPEFHTYYKTRSLLRASQEREKVLEERVKLLARKISKLEWEKRCLQATIGRFQPKET